MLLPSAVTRKPGGGAAFAPNGLNFYNGGAGNNYLISTMLTSVVDSALGSISIWVRIDAASGTDAWIKGTNSNQKFIVFRNGSDNSLIFSVFSSGGLQYFVQSNANAITDNAWHHILASWDTNHTPAAAKLGTFYLDEVSIKVSVVADDPAFSVNYTGENPTFPRSDSNARIALSEIWYAPGQYVDFTNATNRNKFSAGGHPISLGTDGSTPTGVAPAVYLHNVAATAGTNSGTGGNFTAQGTITDTATP